MPKKQPSKKDEFIMDKTLFMSHPLFEQWPDGLIVIDTKGTIFTINKKAEELLGYELEELEGRSLHSVLCGPAADYQHKEEVCPFINVEQNLAINHIIDAWFVKKTGIFLHVDVKNVVNLFDNDNINASDFHVLSFQDCSTKRYSEKE